MLTKAGEEQDPSRTFRIGEIKSITYEGDDDKDMNERYLVQVYGIHDDTKLGRKETLKSRLDRKHLPAYLPAEATAEDKKARFKNMKLSKDVVDDPEFQLEIAKATFLPLPPTLLNKNGTIRAVSKHMIREYFKDFQATQRANAEAQQGRQKKKRLKRKEVDGSSMRSVLGKRNKAFRKHGEDFIYTIDIREQSLIQKYGSKTDSGKRKRDTGSSSTIKEKKRKSKKKKNKNTESKPFVDAEGNSNTAKHMSTIDDMVRSIENFVRQMNE